MDTRPKRSNGLGASLRAGLNAGLLCGFVLGLVDGVVAGLRTGVSGAGTWIGCLGASTVSYGIPWVVALTLLALVGHVFLRRHGLGGRLRRLAALGLGLGLALDLAWWTRPYVLWGVPSTDPRRLAAFAGMALVGLAAGLGIVVLGRRLPRWVLLAGTWLVPLAWVAGLWHLGGEASDARQRGRLNERNRARPNVLLVVVDALRQDVLGCYGNERVHTPVIDALAERGVVFETTWAQAPFSWSSFGSILTGKYPRRHGLVKMAPGVRMASNVTLPWHLKTARMHGEEGALEPDDFVAAAFLTGTLSHGSGLLRGFDVYFEAMAGHDLVRLESPWSVFRSELVLSLVRTKVAGRLLRWRSQDPVVATARAWLRDHARRRFVSLVHFYSTHTPYDAPRRFRQMYVDPAYDGPIATFDSGQRAAVERGEVLPTRADREHIANLYFAGVSQADAMLGEILDELEDLGVLDDTLVILTADHGEELGDHGVWEHNFMYETNLLVPLVMALPGRLPQGVRSAALVETVDLVPTVCSLLAVEPPHEPDRIDELGRDRGAIDGVDLTALARGQVPSVKDHAFAENGVYLAVRDRRYKLVVAAEALDLENWRSPPRPGVEAARLFDLVADPRETENVLAELPDEAERLLAELRRFDRSMPVPRSDVVQSPRDIEAQRLRLQQLGYGEGVGQGAADPRQGVPDPGQEE